MPAHDAACQHNDEVHVCGSNQKSPLASTAPHPLGCNPACSSSTVCCLLWASSRGTDADGNTTSLVQRNPLQAYNGWHHPKRVFRWSPPDCLSLCLQLCCRDDRRNCAICMANHEDPAELQGLAQLDCQACSALQGVRILVLILPGDSRPRRLHHKGLCSSSPHPDRT